MPLRTIRDALETISQHDSDSTELRVDDSTEPSIDFPIGMLLNGRYRLESMIGQGGMGVVYRATDVLNEHIVALKTIRGRLIQPRRLSWFKAEFKVMTQLRHPNIATVFDFEAINEGDDHFFTLEYVAGRTLFEATVEQSFAVIVERLVEICRALSYIHDHRIVHYDLKPSNVLVRDDGTLKVLDFGLVGARGGARAPGVIGTPAYMAPEVASGLEVDHRSDLYSLGIMLYQLLCRRLPFAASDAQALFVQHTSAPVVFTEAETARIPAWLRGIVHKLCEKTPAQRFQHAKEIIAAVNRGGGIRFEVSTRATRESYLMSSRFIGRRAELDQLLEAAVTRSQGRSEAPASWLIVGAQGIGKSRLIREARHLLQLARLPVVEGAFVETDASPFGSLIPVFRHLGTLATASSATTLSIEPDLTRAVTQVEKELCTFALALADNVPFVILLEDLQWAPAPALRVLQSLGDGIRLREASGLSSRFMVIATCRADEAVAAGVTKVQADPQRRVLPLCALSGDEVQELVCSMLGVEAVSAALAAEVFAQTAGNPSAIEAFMRGRIGEPLVG